MTEEEAKTKWCPQCDRGINVDGSWMFRCIASECPAWRWSDDNLLTGYRSSTLDPPSGYEKREDGYLERLIPEGHCGLGGKP